MNILRRLLGFEPPNNQPEPSEQAIQPSEDSAHTNDLPLSFSLGASPYTPPTMGNATTFGVTRQLPPLETALASRPNLHVSYGQSSDTGMVRNNNQDSILTWFLSQGNTNNVPDLGLFIVADGMGGHHDGEKASMLVSRIVAAHIIRHAFLPILTEDHHTDAEKPTLSEILVDAVREANEMVIETIPEGGTTITAAALFGDLAYIVHVGDSRAYLITKDYGIEQITRDHSLVQRLIELDQLTPEEAAHHPQKNVLYRAIGQSESLEVDALTRRLPGSSYLMLCSDGLWNMVPEHEILNIIFSAPTPQDASDHLVAAANEHGGADNISVILLRVPG